MTNSSSVAGQGKHKFKSAVESVSLEHYVRILLHRKWVIVGTFVVVSALTAGIAYKLPDIFTSNTLILVDPQKVPDAYVKATVSGDVRNRLGTLSQQILSATRLQKIIDSLNLYPSERKTLAREDVITKMRKDISVAVVSDFGGSQDLQAFRITYSGKDPRLVAQVANELATQFIDENLKAREQQATDTTEFMQSQLVETRKNLETQESKLRDFRMKHVGEMPEQENADLQILGQVQSQLQLESEALARAEQQKTYLQSMMTTTTGTVVELDDSSESAKGAPTRTAAPAAAVPVTRLGALRAQLTAAQSRYGEAHPQIRKLRILIAEEEAANPPAAAAPAAAAPVEVAAAVPVEAATPKTRKPAGQGPQYVNPVLQSQLKVVDDEIGKHKSELQRLNKLAGGYHAKLEAIPVRQQEISTLVRDYEISKAHYSQLLDKQLAAETATQLEIRQKGEKFSVLDPAQPAENPSSPHRAVIDAAGCLAGLGLGLMLALVTEFLGMSITGSDQLTEATGIPVLEVIPVIQTFTDRLIRRRRIIIAAASFVLLTVLASGAALFIHYRS
jgi:polysaccharide chain length determinant protein (PEP-CTERM system associated)